MTSSAGSGLLNNSAGAGFKPAPVTIEGTVDAVTDNIATGRVRDRAPTRQIAMAQKKTTHKSSTNKLCTSCRRTCKQLANAVVAKCPRYYPFNRLQSKRESTWKQMELGL